MLVSLYIIYTMVKKAVLVGINYYSTSSARLNGCINDILNMKKTLINNYGYKESDIIVLRDDINNASTAPTASNIWRNLCTLIANSASCEEIWFHYSGHGAQIRDTSGDEKSGRDSVIVPSDFMSVGVIPDDYIYSAVKNSRAGKTMFLFDSCNSGTVCDLIWSFEYMGGTSFQRTKNNNLAISNPNIFMISGCKDVQTAADIYDTEDKQFEGAFTNEFLRALSYYKYNGSIFDIYKKTCTNLSAAGYSQKPILSTTTATPAYSFKKVTGPGLTKVISGPTQIKTTKSGFQRSVSGSRGSSALAMGGLMSHSHALRRAAVAAKQ
jgi:hypothetical protein